MKYFAGLDVSLKETSVCILDETGVITREFKVPSHPEDLVRVLRDFSVNFVRIGLEAGPLSQWLFSGRSAWEKELVKVSGKSKTAAAIRYAMTRRQSLERVLTDGRIEIDSNIVGRAIRPQTMTRKNSLFAGSEGGGNTWATIATLLQTAKMNDVDPLAWLTQTLVRIANRWPAHDIEALMQWNFNPGGIA